MSATPLVSIVVNNYNYGRYLKAAVDSALAQTHRNTEVIVVDDGSTDDSPAIIASYGDRVAAVVKENGGQASAFNAGFARTRGEVVLFLDADDLLLPTAVERAVAPFNDPAVAKVQWPLREVDEQCRQSGRVQPNGALADGDLREHVIRHGPLKHVWSPTSGNAWSRYCLERIGPVPEEKFRISADTFLAALAPLFGVLIRIEQPEGLYRVHRCNSFRSKPFAEKVAGAIERRNCCFDVAGARLREMGVTVNREAWVRQSWWHNLGRFLDDLAAVVPQDSTFILVDEDQWQTDDTMIGRRRIPFLERNGRYWGPPADDETAIRELERLRSQGAEYLLVGWPGFWWLDHYSGLRAYLQNGCKRLVANDCVIAYALPQRGFNRPVNFPR